MKLKNTDIETLSLIGYNSLSERQNTVIAYEKGSEAVLAIMMEDNKFFILDEPNIDAIGIPHDRRFEVKTVCESDKFYEIPITLDTIKHITDKLVQWQDERRTFIYRVFALIHDVENGNIDNYKGTISEGTVGARSLFLTPYDLYIGEIHSGINGIATDTAKPYDFAKLIDVKDDESDFSAKDFFKELSDPIWSKEFAMSALKVFADKYKASIEDMKEAEISSMKALFDITLKMSKVIKK